MHHFRLVSLVRLRSARTVLQENSDTDGPAKRTDGKDQDGGERAKGQLVFFTRELYTSNKCSCRKACICNTIFLLEKTVVPTTCLISILN